MHSLRALILGHRAIALAVLVLALCIKAAMPAGFMLSSSPDRVLSVTICAESTGGLETMRLVIPGKAHDESRVDQVAKSDQCAFSGLAKLAIGGADAILLAAVLAFILVLGLTPLRRLAFRPISHLRPPLRGPPAHA